MRPDGSAQARITIAETTYEQEPVWSPDGRGLAYAGKMNESDYDIYLIHTTGMDLDASDPPAGAPQSLVEFSVLTAIETLIELGKLYPRDPQLWNLRAKSYAALGKRLLQHRRVEPDLDARRGLEVEQAGGGGADNDDFAGKFVFRPFRRFCRHVAVNITEADVLVGKRAAAPVEQQVVL